jgi:hypothetical protein
LFTGVCQWWIIRCCLCKYYIKIPWKIPKDFDTLESYILTSVSTSVPISVSISVLISVSTSVLTSVLSNILGNISGNISEY